MFLDSSYLPEPPKTAAASAALSVATRFCSPALLNHSIRSYVWGTIYASDREIPFDNELYYVASLLHDIGLTVAFDNQQLSFEDAGGHLAWVFGTASGWSVGRTAQAARSIVTHMRGDVSASEDPESHLLQVATSWDVSGRRPKDFSAEKRTAVLNRYPRLGFGTEFLAAFEDQAQRKPDCAAAQSIARGIASRIASNPLDLGPDE